jgi:hypothetical protein
MPVGPGAVAINKTLMTREQDRPDVAEERTRWRATPGAIDPARYGILMEASVGLLEAKR